MTLGAWISQPPKPKTRAIDQTAAGIKLLELESGVYQEPLVVSIHGDRASGKSRMIGTVPGNIGVLPMEHKSRQSILKAAAEFGKKVIMPEIDLIRSARASLVAMMPFACVTADDFNGMNLKTEDAEKRAEREMQAKAKAIPLDGEQPECCQRCHYRWHVNRSKSVAFRMAEREDIRTIVIDTFGQLIDDILFANYGRNEHIMPLDRKTFNREVSEFISAISHKNLIFTHHSATIWKDNKPTNRTKPMSSFSKLGHYVSVEIEMTRNDDALKRNQDPRRQQDKPMESVYTMTVNDCQANPELVGLDLLFDESINFQNLAALVYTSKLPT
jgi:hypothetical protein